MLVSSLSKVGLPNGPTHAYFGYPHPPNQTPMIQRLHLFLACCLLATSLSAQSDGIYDPLQFYRDTVERGPATQVQFEAMEHDFGQIYQDSENPHVFRFKNTGDIPLIITGATGSCGCTVPYYSKEPILPGAESEIHIEYKPGRQEGQQRKTVTITANTEPVQTVLMISAEVLKIDEEAAPSIFARDEAFEKDLMAIESVNPGCFVLFPNPTSNELQLDLKGHIGRSADVRIHDQTGRDMLQTRIPAISSEASRLDVAAFPAGIYIATIQVEGQAPMSQCFVVSR